MRAPTFTPWSSAACEVALERLASARNRIAVLVTLAMSKATSALFGATTKPVEGRQGSAARGPSARHRLDIASASASRPVIALRDMSTPSRAVAGS